MDREASFGTPEISSGKYATSRRKLHLDKLEGLFAEVQGVADSINLILID